MKFYRILLILTAAMLAQACSGSKAGGTDQAQSEAGFEAVETFSADSAYSYVARQVAFGPRVPGTAAHDACAEWIVAKLREFGADTVYLVGTTTTVWDGTRLPVRNIFAKFKGISDEANPILLAAHYDTRPWADNDADPAARTAPFDGANDGASGVGVLLEIARNIGSNPGATGVDFLFTDVEDYGAPQDASVDENTWCLGAIEFAEKLPYTQASKPRYGILLDMVGGRDARFPREYFSTGNAPKATAKVWGMASRLGLGERFPMRIGGAITDDHIPLINAGIPTTDIIESENKSTGSFPPTWHTRQDNMENIDRTTLGDVGRVVLNVVYNEN